MASTGVFHTEKIGTPMRLVQVLGLTSSAFLCGKTFAQSYHTTPSFLLAPAPLLAQQWQKMFDGDKLLTPVLVVFNGIVFGVLASKETRFSSPAVLYTTASTLLFSTIPYSILLLHPIAENLKSKARYFSTNYSASKDCDAEVGVKREETVHYLVDQWAVMNLGRAVLAGVAGILAVWAAVGKVRVREIRIPDGLGMRVGR